MQTTRARLIIVQMVGIVGHLQPMVLVPLRPGPYHHLALHPNANPFFLLFGKTAKPRRN